MPSDPATAPTPHLPVRPEWLAARREEILEPELPIVDPHHHLVDRANTGRYLLPELLADTGSGRNITATVYLEWLSMYRAEGPACCRSARSNSPTASRDAASETRQDQGVRRHRRLCRSDARSAVEAVLRR
jgi:hypothetical protein